MKFLAVDLTWIFFLRVNPGLYTCTHMLLLLLQFNSKARAVMYAHILTLFCRRKPCEVTYEQKKKNKTRYLHERYPLSPAVVKREFRRSGKHAFQSCAYVTCTVMYFAVYCTPTLNLRVQEDDAWTVIGISIYELHTAPNCFLSTFCESSGPDIRFRMRRWRSRFLFTRK